MFIVASRWSRNRSPKRWISFISPLVETISFFPRYYLVSPPLCHGPTKFEAFIECLGSEDRPLPQRSQDLLHLPSTAQISLRPSTCTCITFLLRLDVSRLYFPRWRQRVARACRSHEDGIFSVFSSLIQVPALGPDFPCKGTQVCAARLCTPCSRYPVAIQGEKGRTSGAAGPRF